MSKSTVVTLGYGGHGNVGFIVLLGYTPPAFVFWEVPDAVSGSWTAQAAGSNSWTPEAEEDVDWTPED